MEELVTGFISELGTIPSYDDIDLDKLDYLNVIQPHSDITSAVRYFLDLYPMLPIEAVQRYACNIYEKPFNSKTKRFLKRHEDEYLNDGEKRISSIRERLLAKLKKKQNNNEKI